MTSVPAAISTGVLTTPFSSIGLPQPGPYTSEIASRATAASPNAHGMPMMALIRMLSLMYLPAPLRSPEANAAETAGRIEIAIGNTKVDGKRSEIDSESVVYDE